MENSDEKRISEYDFIVKAIKKLRKHPYKGIRSVYSGFNQAFRDYFNKNPVKATTRLVEDGKLVTRPVKGGVILYLPEDAPFHRQSKTVLDKILEEDKPGKNLEILGPADEENES